MRSKVLGLLFVAAVAATAWMTGCSTSSSTPSSSGAPAAGSKSARGATPTPTPSLMSRTNPNIVEEDDIHFVERIPRGDVLQVDEKHIRYPFSPLQMEFFKSDAGYFYLYTYKRLPDEEALKRQALEQSLAQGKGTTSVAPVAPLTDFDDLAAPTLPSSPVRFQEMKDTGLPVEGLWRASFVIADMNGDGIPDLVAPPARLGGDSLPHVWLGDGKGHFTRWKLSFTEGGKPTNVSVDYGGIAVGDIDGDGHLDIVSASHNGGILAFFGDGKGGFAVSREGLPAREFSAQAVTLVDADGDGKLDIVASKDVVDPGSTEPVDLNQVRLYVFKPGRKWEFRPGSLAGAAYSYSLTPWDYDGAGRPGILTGSHYFAAQVLLWKNGGKGTFSPVAFPELESYAFHYRTAPGTWGPGKRPAFAETYQKFMQTPNAKACGVNVYSMDGTSWSKHPVLRKKNANPYLYALAYGDLDGDGRDDVVFPDSEAGRVRVFLQRADGSFAEIPAAQEPRIDSPAQCVRLLDVDRDGRMDLVIQKTVSSTSPSDPGGWSIYRNIR